MGRILSLLVLVGFSVFFSSCGDDNNKKDSDEKKQLNKLKFSWTISSAKLDGTDRTGDFTGLQLSISGDYKQDGGSYAYSFTGKRPNPSPWPSSGTWKFGSPATTQIIRLDDNVTMNYAVTDSQLTISFACATCDFAGSRVNQVNGQWEFVFTK